MPAEKNMPQRSLSTISGLEPSDTVAKEAAFQARRPSHFEQLHEHNACEYGRFRTPAGFVPNATNGTAHRG